MSLQRHNTLLAKKCSLLCSADNIYRQLHFSRWKASETSLSQWLPIISAEMGYLVLAVMIWPLFWSTVWSWTLLLGIFCSVRAPSTADNSQTWRIRKRTILKRRDPKTVEHLTPKRLPEYTDERAHTHRLNSRVSSRSAKRGEKIFTTDNSLKAERTRKEFL